jgi:hypothetical protein
MSRKQIATEFTRQWITGTVVLLITIVYLFSFAKISMFAGIVVSSTSLVILLVLSWILGERKRRRGGGRDR